MQQGQGSMTMTVVVAIIALLVGGWIGRGIKNKPADQNKIEQAKEERNKQTVERTSDEFKNKANHDIVFESYAPDAKIHVPLPIPPTREGLKAAGQAIVAAFPDVHVTLNDVIAAGDKVIERTTATATHKGTFNGIPATNKKVTWTEIHIYQFNDEGKIIEQWSEINIAGLMAQITAK